MESRLWKENKKLIDNIITKDKYQSMKTYYAHKNISCYEHSIKVCKGCLDFVEKHKIKCNIEDLIKGALLHDYYLYDWHKQKRFNFHGLKHHRISINNAKKDYETNRRIENMIYSHMFPLTFWTIPLYKESWILTLIDKTEATGDLKRRKK